MMNMGKRLPLIALVTFFMSSASHMAVAQNNELVADAPAVVVSVYTEDAEGLTTADFDQQRLMELQGALLERVRKMAAQYEAKNPTLRAFEITAMSTYSEIGHIKLAVIDVFANKRHTSMNVIGIKGSEKHRISCVTRNPVTVSPFSESCNDAIEAVFGVRLKLL